MTDQPVGTVLQYALEAPDLPTLLRQLAESIEALGPDAEVHDIAINTKTATADVYFSRT